MIRSSRIYLVTKLFRLIPETRGFALKARLLQWAGVQLGARGARLFFGHHPRIRFSSNR